LATASSTGQHVADVGDLLVVDEDEGVFQLNILVLLVIDEIGREVAAIELHALDHIQLVVQGLAFLDGDDAFLANLLHGLGDDLADGLVGVGGDGANLGNGLVLGTGLGQDTQFGDHGLNGLVDTALEVHGVHASGNGLEALAQHGLGQDGGSGGAVTRDVGGLGGDFLDHLGAHVLEPILELDFLGDGDAVLGDGGSAKALLQHHVAALGTQGDLDGVGQDVNAGHHPNTGIIAKFDVFCAHA
jgi:hypothetical protein